MQSQVINSGKATKPGFIYRIKPEVLPGEFVASGLFEKIGVF
jgi:hypothetical protein